MPISRIAFVLLSLFLLSACAGGRDFIRPAEGELKLGELTRNEALKRFGTPVVNGEQEINGNRLDLISYAYTTISGQTTGNKVIRSRGMGFMFHKNLLVRHGFSSSFPKDSTAFDESLREQIVPGKSTFADVVALYGRPDGVQIHPLVENKDHRALIYIHTHYASRLNSTTKELIIELGPDDVVVDVNYFARSS